MSAGRRDMLSGSVIVCGSRGFETVLIAGTIPSGEDDMTYFAAEHGVEPHYIEEMSRELSPMDAVSLWKIYSAL